MICGPQDRRRATISGLRGYRSGGERGSAERATAALIIGETDDDEAVDLARDGPVEAVPGDARRGGFRRLRRAG